MKGRYLKIYKVCDRLTLYGRDQVGRQLVGRRLQVGDCVLEQKERLGCNKHAEPHGERSRGGDRRAIL